MATPREVLALEELHQAAQARLGLAAAFLSLAEWENVAALNATGTAAVWLTKSLRAIAAIRKMSRKLAISYYQLARALETGRTLGVPEGSEDRTVTLGTLRKNFRDNAIDVASLPSTRTRSDDPDIRWFEESLQELDSQDHSNSRAVRLADVPVDPLIQNLLDVEGTDDAKSIEVDRYDWGDDMSLDEVDRTFRELLRKQAVDHSSSTVEKIRADEDLSTDEALDQIEVAHAAAGSIGSGTVDAAGMDGGRQAIVDAIRKDRLVKVVARGTSHDPCAFCAMLASRGFIYKSEMTAGVGEEVEKVHVNCHCFPIVRFVRESQLPELNRYFQEKWAEVTRGYSGNEARKAWRRWIYAQRKANPSAPHGALNNKTN
jgi:hypothetical protein